MEILKILKERFDSNMNRHPNIKWEDVLSKIENNETYLNTLIKMEETAGEPDVVVGLSNNPFDFVDCSIQSPDKRRSLCYHKEAWEKRKQNKPRSSAMELMEEIGIEMIDYNQYEKLQDLFLFDTKTSSWINTEKWLRVQGIAEFCERRFGKTYTFHNGAESYYANRGVRGILYIE